MYTIKMMNKSRGMRSSNKARRVFFICQSGYESGDKSTKINIRNPVRFKNACYLA